MAKDTLSPQEAANLLGVSMTTVYSLLKRGGLTSIKNKERLYLSKAEILRLQLDDLPAEETMTPIAPTATLPSEFTASKSGFYNASPQLPTAVVRTTRPIRFLKGFRRLLKALTKGLEAMIYYLEQPND